MKMKTIYSHILLLILAILNALSINAAIRISSDDYNESVYYMESTDNYESFRVVLNNLTPKYRCVDKFQDFRLEEFKRYVVFVVAVRNVQNMWSDIDSRVNEQ